MAFSKAFLVLSLLCLVILISSEVSARKFAESTAISDQNTSMFFTSFLLLVFWGGILTKKTFDKLYFTYYDMHNCSL